MTIDSPSIAKRGLSLILRGVPFAAMLPAALLLPLAQEYQLFTRLLASIEIGALFAAVGSFVILLSVKEQPGRGFLIAATALFGLTFVRGLLFWCGLGFGLMPGVSGVTTYLLGLAAWLCFLRPVMEELGLVSFVGYWRQRWVIRYYAVTGALAAVGLWAAARSGEGGLAFESHNISAIVPFFAVLIGQLVLLIAGWRVGRALGRQPSSESSSPAEPGWLAPLMSGTKIVAGVLWIGVVLTTVFARWPNYPHNTEDKSLGAVAVALSAAFALSAIARGTLELIGKIPGGVIRAGLNGGLALVFAGITFGIFTAGNQRDGQSPAASNDRIPFDAFAPNVGEKPGGLVLPEKHDVPDGGMGVGRADSDVNDPLKKFYRAYEEADRNSPLPIWELSQIAEFAPHALTKAELDKYAADYDFRLGLRVQGVDFAAVPKTVFAHGKKSNRDVPVLYFGGSTARWPYEEVERSLTSGPDYWPLVNFYKACVEYEATHTGPPSEWHAVLPLFNLADIDRVGFERGYTFELGRPIRGMKREELAPHVMGYEMSVTQNDHSGFVLFFDGTIKILSHQQFEALQSPAAK